MSANLPGFGERVRGHRWQGRAAAGGGRRI